MERADFHGALHGGNPKRRQRGTGQGYRIGRQGENGTHGVGTLAQDHEGTGEVLVPALAQLVGQHQ